MALSTPYPGIMPPYKGNVTETQADLNAWIERVHRAGIQVNCHANGDVAIDMVLTAVERAQKAFPRADARPKITHCTQMNADLVRRMKATGTVPAAFTTYAYYNSDKFAYYGEELMKSCMAYRSWLDAGIVAAAGSDFSPGPFDPRMAIQGMATRKGWDGKTWGANQKITIEEALRVNTINVAYNSTRSDQGISYARQASGFRSTFRRSVYGRHRQDQGSADRAHRGGWEYGPPGVNDSNFCGEPRRAEQELLTEAVLPKQRQIDRLAHRFGACVAGMQVIPAIIGGYGLDVTASLSSDVTVP
jgi:hypothetical protein